MKLNVIAQRKFWWLVSLSITIAGLIAMAISWQTLGSPLRLGLDFVGGTRLQLELACQKSNSCGAPLETAPIQAILNEEGLDKGSVQIIEKYGVSIRTGSLTVEQRTKLQQTLDEKIGTFDPETVQIDTVGPTIGKELFRAGIAAVLVSFVGIVLYLAVRFQWDYAFFAILALFHDVQITVGVFAILGLVLGTEVDSLFLVALLTIIGFSVNDTVVIYDRIRETAALEGNMGIDKIVNDAVNQTLGRSINTSLSSTLPLIAIFLFGGDTLKNFALALIVGFVSGAYSSIFIASTTLAWWRKRSERPQLTTEPEPNP